MAQSPPKSTLLEQNEISTKSNSKKNIFSHKLSKNNLYIKYNKEFNFLLFYFFLLILPKRYLIAEEFSITIDVNQLGPNKILSDEYSNSLPTNIQLENKIYNFAQNQITLKWNSGLKDLSFMFNDLDTITSVTIKNMFIQNCALAYMFKNCINLKSVTFEDLGQQKHAIKNMRGMFYNCQSLESFSFKGLYLRTLGKVEVYDYYNN